jgi:tetratricopeptide (TPR) repeat protein
VLDDLHALAPAQRELLVAELARGLDRGRMIATSRELVPMAVGDVDRLHLRLAPLDRAATAELCGELAARLGPGLELERVWEASRGNPFLVRQAHVGIVDAHNPLDDAAASLDGLERAMAVALALAQAPLAQAVLAALAPGGSDGAPALHALAMRLIAERGADRTYAMHDLVRESVLRGVALEDQHEVRGRLIDALTAALPGAAGELVGLATELAHHLRAAGRFADLAAVLDQLGIQLSRRGADGFVLRELQALPDAVITPSLRVLRARTLCHGLQIRRAYELLSAGCPGDASARLLLGNVATWAGAWDHAEAVLGAIADAPAHPAKTRTRAELGLAWARVNRGTWSAASMARLQRAGAPPLYLEALRLCDALLRESVADRADAALALIDDLEAAPREPWARLVLPMLLALVLARAGELAAAERLVAWAEADLELPRERIEITSTRAIIAIERGERIAGVAALRRSVRLLDRGGFFAGRAWTRTALGRLLYQLGRRREAAAVLDELRALCAAHGTTAYLPGIAAAEQDDPLHPAWLAPRVPPPPPAKRGEAIRHQIRAALRMASGAAGTRPGDEPPPLELPEGADFALDRACLAIAHAVLARRRGQPRRAAQHLRRGVAEASAGGVDAELVPALHDALARPLARALPGDELVIDLEHHEVTSAGRRLSLASRPVLRALLYAFAERPAHQLSHDEIAHVLWQGRYDPDRHASTLRSNVRRLRAVVRPLGVEIVHEADGYRLALPGGVRLTGARP